MIDISTPEEKPIIIPAVGKRFLIERNEYEVIYINYGKGRFTCIPLGNSELPSVGKTFMLEGHEYFVSHLDPMDPTKKRFVFEPYFGGENETQA
jgi:hypothetical protein